MTTIQFVGLGTMGEPMVRQLRSAGYEVCISDVNEAHATALAAELGATCVPSGGVGEGVDTVILMLPNSNIVTAVLQGENGLAARLAPGTLIIDMSSSAPERTKVLADELAELGLSLVDAPVSGGPRKAETGELTIMVGSPEGDALDRALPILHTLGSTVFETGPVASAHALKALNNLLSLISIVGAAEVLTVGAKFGIEPRVMLDVINSSTGRNQATEVKFGPHVLGREWNVGFSLALTVKDVETALALAEQTGSQVPLSAVAVETAKAALAHFDGQQPDQSRIAAFIEERNGVSLADQA